MATPNQPSSTRAALKNTFGSLRHRPPKEVPAGTVASRISYLQSLASGTTRRSPSTRKPTGSVRSKARPAPKGDIAVYEDGGGYGRRPSARFGYPAQRNDDPHSDPPEDKGQKTRGWQIKRAKNEDDNKSIKSTSSSKRGFRAKVKDVFTHGERQEPYSPEIISVNARTVPVSVTKPQRDYSWQTREPPSQPVYSSSNMAVMPSRCPTAVHVSQPPPLAKVASRDFAEEALVSGHKVHNWLAEAHSDSLVGSEDSVGRSVATTSTGRVRSVQQMYSSYGIPEPSELFTNALPSSRVVGGEPRRCHVCKWVNVGVERCTCCGHRLCADCIVETSAASKASAAASTARLLLETDDENEEDSTYSRYSISQLPHKTSIEFKEENWAKATLTARKRSSRHSPLTIKPKVVPKVGVFEERFDLPQKIPSIAVPFPHLSGDGTSPPHPVVLSPTALYQPLRHQRESLNRSPPISPELVLAYARALSPPRMLAPEVVNPKKKSIVKDSPFMKADKDVGKTDSPKLKRVTRKGVARVHPTTPAPPPSDSSFVVAAASDALSQQSSKQLGALSKEDDMSSIKCDSPTCRATHTGYRPYRHSISCSWKKAGQAVSTAPSSPQHAINKLLAEPLSPLMPKPLSPLKRKTDEMKAMEAAASQHPVVAAVPPEKPMQENVKDKIKKLSAESEITIGQDSRAAVSMLANTTEPISPLGSDGHEDEQPTATAGSIRNPSQAPPLRNSRKERARSRQSESGSYSPTITSTGQITTIYETSIVEHRPDSKRGRRAGQRLVKGRCHQAAVSFEEDTRHPSRGSAEMSHEELLRRKHRAQHTHPDSHTGKPRLPNTFGFCPRTPHTHIIEHSTEYIECHPEPYLDTSITSASQQDITRSSIDHGTFSTNHREVRTNRQTNTSETASACMPGKLERKRTELETRDAMNSHQPQTVRAGDEDYAHGHGGEGRLKHLDNSVVHRGNSVLKSGWSNHESLVKPRLKLEEQKRRAKYGNLDPALAEPDRGHPGQYDRDHDNSRQQHRALPESTRVEPEHLESSYVSETSDEPEPSTRARYAERRQGRPDQQQRGQVHYRKEGVTYSRDIKDQGDYDRQGNSFEHLSTQPSFGNEYRHQSHPAHRSRRDSGVPPQSRSGQSIAGHETFSHHNTGLLAYSGSSSDSYYDDNHSTMSGMSREIVFETGPHGKGALVLPVAATGDARHLRRTDLEREQSRKVNRAGLRVSKSVRHIVGAAGPTLPAAMSTTIEDGALSVNDHSEDLARESNLGRKSTRADRAGLRMSNSVRNIVGADGPMSFSHPVGQHKSPTSSDGHSQSSIYDSNSPILPDEAEGLEDPTMTRSQSEYSSRRRERSGAPSPNLPPTKGGLFRSLVRSGFYARGGQGSSQTGETSHGQLAPSRERTQYHGSANPALPAKQERSPMQPISASKVAMFEKLQTAPDIEHSRTPQGHHATSSQAITIDLTTSSPDRLLPEEGETPSHESHAATNDKPTGRSKHRIVNLPRSEASKRRKLSAANEDESVMQAGKLLTASFFDTMRANALEIVNAEKGKQLGSLSVQSLKEKFSSSPVQQSSPSKAPNPLRKMEEVMERDLGNSALAKLQQLQKFDPAQDRDAAKTTMRAQSVQSSAFSVDGARSRIHTIAAQKAPQLPVMPGVHATSHGGVARARPLPTSRTKEAPAEESKDIEAAAKRKTLLKHLGWDEPEEVDDATAPHTNDADGDDEVFSCHDRNLQNKKGLPAAPKAPSPQTQTALLVEQSIFSSPCAASPKERQGGILSRETVKCALCNATVFKGSLEAHQQICAVDNIEARIIKERAQKEARKRAAEGKKIRDLSGGSSKDATVVDNASSKVISPKLSLSERLGRTVEIKARTAGKGDGAQNDRLQKWTTASPKTPSREARLDEPSLSSRERRGTVSELAKKFQHPNSLVMPAKASSGIQARGSATGLAKEKISGMGMGMGTDGASSGTPVTVLPGRLPEDITRYVAEMFGMAVGELGEVTIEVGEKGRRKRVSCRGWKGEEGRRRGV